MRTKYLVEINKLQNYKPFVLVEDLESGDKSIVDTCFEACILVSSVVISIILSVFGTSVTLKIMYI